MKKTCLKAGHRWGAPIGASRRQRRKARAWWLEIRRCQRAGCDRLRYEDDRGQIFTYEFSTASGMTNVKVIAK